MSLFISNDLIGWTGGFYEKMMPARFWAMHATLAGGGSLLVVFFGRRFKSDVYRSPQLIEKTAPHDKPLTMKADFAFRA
jgi:hypothetical protein